MAKFIELPDKLCGNRLLNVDQILQVREKNGLCEVTWQNGGYMECTESYETVKSLIAGEKPSIVTVEDLNEAIAVGKAKVGCSQRPTCDGCEYHNIGNCQMAMIADYINERLTNETRAKTS